MTRPPASPSLVEDIDRALPQTQCTRCGYPDCRGYAQAIGLSQAKINQCPPGGQEGIERLAALTQTPVIALNPVNGHEGPRGLAVIDEDWCIGCTLCIKACPVDCIVGAPKQMHTVIEDLCTGCELCIPVCPVDCITMDNASGERTGWQAWSSQQARQAQERYAFHRLRIERAQQENAQRLAAKAAHKLEHLDSLTHTATPEDRDRKRAIIEAAIARAQNRRKAP